MRVAYVAGVCVDHDAISNAIRDEIHWLLDAGHEVHLFAYACDHRDLPFICADRESDIVFHPFFQQCDLAVFHFGVFYGLFNALLLTPQRAKRVVVFHNITPKQFLPASAHDLIDRSFAQLSNAAFADHIVCDSKVNQQVLVENGIKTPSTVIPLPVHATLTAPPAKPSFGDGVVRILFLGRFVKSKGPLELLAGLAALLRSDSRHIVQLEMIGNIKFSDGATIAAMETMIAALRGEFGSRLTINLLGNASDERKAGVLKDADLFVLPTYHEGFCVPIVEAIASGCLVIAYNNSNTPSVSGTLAQLVETGNVMALESAMRHDVAKIVSSAWKAGGYQQRITEANRHIRKFEPAVIREQYLDFVERRVGTRR